MRVTVNAGGRCDQRAAKHALRSWSLAGEPLLPAPQLGLGSREREDRDGVLDTVRLRRVQRDLETAHRALKFGDGAGRVPR
jgi:hypothetical protein